MKKRTVVLLLALFSVFAALSGCEAAQSPEPSQSTPGGEAQSASSIDNSKTYVGMMVQEYIGDNIAEIPMIFYDADQEALAGYDYHNPEIDRLNTHITDNIALPYNEFMSEYDATERGGWMEIRAYPFSDERYIQIVMTCISYPSYGTDGEIVSCNFDREANEWVELDDALERLGLTRESLVDDAYQAVKAEWTEYPGDADGPRAPWIDPNLSIEDMAVKGFRYLNSATTEFYLEVLIDNTAADAWKYFYRYVLTDGSDIGTASRFADRSLLFDPSEPDVMKPPLCYAF
jgi:hypothetical protein